MKKFFLILGVLAALIGGFLYFFGKASVTSFAIRQFHVETGLQLTFKDWERVGNRIKVFNPRIRGADLSQSGELTANYLQIIFDADKILSQELTLNEILIDGMKVDSPSDKSAFFSFIETLAKPPSGKGLRIKLFDLKGINFQKSQFRFGKTTVELQPEQLLMSFRDEDHPTIMGRTPIEIDVGLPGTLTRLNKVIGELTVSDQLLSPEASVELRLANYSTFKLEAALSKGVLTVRPTVQAELDSGLKTHAQGEFELKNLVLRANNIVLTGLPLELITHHFDHASSKVVANGDVNLLNLAGDLNGSVSVTDIKALPIGISNFSFGVQLTNRQVQFNDVSIDGKAGKVIGNAAFNFESGSIEGQIKTDKLLLKEPDLKARVPRGLRLNSQIDLSGTPNEPRVSGPTSLEFIRVGINNIENIEATLRTAVDLTLKPERLVQSVGAVTLEPINIETQGREIRTLIPITLKIADGVVDLPSSEVHAGDKVVLVKGRVSEQGYDLSAKGEAELGSLFGLRDNIQDVKGNILVQLTLSGELSKPQLTGSVELSEAGFAIPLSGDRFHIDEISGKATFDETNFILEEFENQSGDASLKANGQVLNFLAPERSGAIQLKVEDFSIQPDPNLSVKLHALAQLNLIPGLPPSFSADISIDDALYEQRSNLQALVKKLLSYVLKRSESGGTQKVFFPLPGVIKVAADRSIVIDTDIFQSELSSKVTLTSDPDGVVIDGSVSGDSGILKLGNNRFDISRASVLFSNQLLGSSPRFELKAEGDLGPRGQEELVQLDIAGQLPNPNVQLRSETGRSQRELLAELGLAVDKVSIFSNENSAPTTSTWLSAINPFSKSGLVDQVQDITSRAKVQVESGYSADTGTFAPRLLLEQELPFDFRLVAHSELSQFNRSEVNIEYPLTEQTNIFTGWKNAPTTVNPERLTGSFGVGVHYRERFPGTTIFPGGLLLENLQSLFGTAKEEEYFSSQVPR